MLAFLPFATMSHNITKYLTVSAYFPFFCKYVSQYHWTFVCQYLFSFFLQIFVDIRKTSEKTNIWFGHNICKGLVVISKMPHLFGGAMEMHLGFVWPGDTIWLEQMWDIFAKQRKISIGSQMFCWKRSHSISNSYCREFVFQVAQMLRRLIGLIAWTGQQIISLNISFKLWLELDKSLKHWSYKAL